MSRADRLLIALALLLLAAVVIGGMLRMETLIQETRALSESVRGLTAEVRQMAQERPVPELTKNDMETSWPCSTAPDGRCQVIVTRAPGQKREAWIAAFDARVAQKRVEFPPGT